MTERYVRKRSISYMLIGFAALLMASAFAATAVIHTTEGVILAGMLWWLLSFGCAGGATIFLLYAFKHYDVKELSSEEGDIE